MQTVRTAKHLLLESTTKSVESGTYDVTCQFCTVKSMVVESEVLKAQSCALSKLSLPVHSNGLTTNTATFWMISFLSLFFISQEDGKNEAISPGRKL